MAAGCLGLASNMQREPDFNGSPAMLHQTETHPLDSGSVDRMTRDEIKMLASAGLAFAGFLLVLYISFVS